jgi:hypothetical protein
MLAISLINLCAREYQDVAFERIAKNAAGAALTNGANWLDLLNDAQRAVVLARPDANSVTESIQLAAGTRQALPAGALRLLDVSRNMGSDGLTPGRAVRFAERDVQDMVDRDWHTGAPGSVVRDVFYNDKKDPLAFWVRPRIAAAATVHIEATLSKPPTDVTDADAGSITISDVYASPLQAWMLFRAYSMATQAMNQFQRAQFYLGTFYNMLGVKMRNDVFFSPNAPDILPAMPNAG